MIQSVTWPMVTHSENVYRGQHRFATARATKVQRELTGMVLRHTLTRPPLHLGGELNSFVVELTRYSAGVLDTDNLRGALKAVRDSVSAWLGVDDAPGTAVTWRYGQGIAPRGAPQVRVQVVDEDEPDREPYHRVLAPETVEALAQLARNARKVGRMIPSHVVAQAKAQEKAKPRPALQRRLPLLRVYALFPWEQPANGDPVLVSVPRLERAERLPASIMVRVPLGASGKVGETYVCRVGRRRVELSISADRLELHRHPWREDDGRDAWVYLPDGVRL